MATLVTGATGFVASNTVLSLAQRGHTVVGLDLVAPDALVQARMQPHSDQITFVQGDILSDQDLERAVAGRAITRIVHAAVFTTVSLGVEAERSRSVVDINIQGTVNLLELARSLSLERFVYVSSGAVYGGNLSVGHVLHEDSTLHPRTLYAVTKYTSELLTRRYGELHGFEAACARLSSPYGPMERVTGHRVQMSPIYEWTRDVMRGDPIHVGDRSAGRDFTHVSDIAAGICAVVDAPSPSYDVYNISGGKWITLDEVIHALRSLRPSVQVIDKKDTQFEIFRPDSSRGPLDDTRLREDLGFKASFDITSGLRDYLEWRERSGFLG